MMSLISDLFVPPPSAMQFELNAECAAIAGIPVLWVEGPYPVNCSKGQCEFGFAVLNAPEPALSRAKKMTGGNGWPSVCACDGKIIE